MSQKQYKNLKPSYDLLIFRPFILFSVLASGERYRNNCYLLFLFRLIYVYLVWFHAKRRDHKIDQSLFIILLEMKHSQKILLLHLRKSCLSYFPQVPHNAQDTCIELQTLWECCLKIPSSQELPGKNFNFCFLQRCTQPFLVTHNAYVHHSYELLASSQNKREKE